MAILSDLRKQYHESICTQILGYRGTIPNIADKGSTASKTIAQGIVNAINLPLCAAPPVGQTLGKRFATATAEFLEMAFVQKLGHLRPGLWRFSTLQGGIAPFEQYRHLSELKALIRNRPELKAALGGNYIVKPDITVTRTPLSDAEINGGTPFVDAAEPTGRLSPLRADNVGGSPILHASISCKWTMRSDRSQNTRTEALNLIRNRKGNTPRIVVVTMEPLPSRLNSIALGTGDVDCTYHAALYELITAVQASPHTDQAKRLDVLVEGRRLRDISDLPLDLAV